MRAMMLTLLCTSALAQEAVVPVSDAAIPLWVQVVVVLVNALVAAVLIPFLRSKQLAAEAETKSHSERTDLTSMEKRQLLSERLKSFLLREAGNTVEKRFPTIANDVLMGKLRTKEEIKPLLYGMGADLKKAAVSYFGIQGIDLAAEVGDQFLDGLIRWAADRVSPFPGKETAVAFLEHSISDMVVKRGVEYVKGQFNGKEDA